jgi:hypothetical protein
MESKNKRQIAEILKLRREKVVFKAKLKKTEISKAKAKTKLPTIVQKKQIATEALSPHFTQAQIGCLLRGKWYRCKEWSHEDIALAVTLCSLSSKTYRFLRRQHILPLPGVSTLKNFFKNFLIPEGYLEVVARMVKLKIEEMDDIQSRVAVLSFDEIYLRRQIDYDRQFDQVLGPHRTANTMMIRGLFSSWKVPIWYMYDRGLTKNELFRVIEELDKIGIHIVATVCDNGSSNVGLQGALGVTMEKPYFDHPSREELMFESLAKAL